jgi:hypothetical protein
MGFQRTKLANRSRLWELAKIHIEFTAHDLSAADKRSLEFVRLAIKDWVRWGYAQPNGKRGNRDLYKVTKKPGTPPVSDEKGRVLSSATPTESMWFVIRKAGVFSFRDVAMQANTEATPVTEDQARDFCRMLVGAGYLRIERKADNKGRLALYRLIHNTGPIPPREKRIRAVWDENKGEFTHVARTLK